jgi:hypothetical protein
VTSARCARCSAAALVPATYTDAQALAVIVHRPDCRHVAPVRPITGAHKPTLAEIRDGRGRAS